MIFRIFMKIVLCVFLTLHNSTAEDKSIKSKSQSQAVNQPTSLVKKANFNARISSGLYLSQISINSLIAQGYNAAYEELQAIKGNINYNPNFESDINNIDLLSYLESQDTGSQIKSIEKMLFNKIIKTYSLNNTDELFASSDPEVQSSLASVQNFIDASSASFSQDLNNKSDFLIANENSQIYEVSPISYMYYAIVILNDIEGLNILNNFMNFSVLPSDSSEISEIYTKIVQSDSNAFIIDIGDFYFDNIKRAGYYLNENGYKIYQEDSENDQFSFSYNNNGMDIFSAKTIFKPLKNDLLNIEGLEDNIFVPEYIYGIDNTGNNAYYIQKGQINYFDLNNTIDENNAEKINPSLIDRAIEVEEGSNIFYSLSEEGVFLTYQDNFGDLWKLKTTSANSSDSITLGGSYVKIGNNIYNSFSEASPHVYDITKDNVDFEVTDMINKAEVIYKNSINNNITVNGQGGLEKLRDFKMSTLTFINKKIDQVFSLDDLYSYLSEIRGIYSTDTEANINGNTLLINQQIDNDIQFLSSQFSNNALSESNLSTLQGANIDKNIQIWQDTQYFLEKLTNSSNEGIGFLGFKYQSDANNSLLITDSSNLMYYNNFRADLSEYINKYSGLSYDIEIHKGYIGADGTVVKDDRIGLTHKTGAVYFAESTDHNYTLSESVLLNAFEDIGIIHNANLSTLSYNADIFLRSQHNKPNSELLSPQYTISYYQWYQDNAKDLDLIHDHYDDISNIIDKIQNFLPTETLSDNSDMLLHTIPLVADLNKLYKGTENIDHLEYLEGLIKNDIEAGFEIEYDEQLGIYTLNNAEKYDFIGEKLSHITNGEQGNQLFIIPDDYKITGIHSFYNNSSNAVDMYAEIIQSHIDSAFQYYKANLSFDIGVSLYLNQKSSFFMALRLGSTLLIEETTQLNDSMFGGMTLDFMTNIGGSIATRSNGLVNLYSIVGFTSLYGNELSFNNLSSVHYLLGIELGIGITYIPKTSIPIGLFAEFSVPCYIENGMMYYQDDKNQYNGQSLESFQIPSGFFMTKLNLGIQLGF